MTHTKTHTKRLLSLLLALVLLLGLLPAAPASANQENKAAEAPLREAAETSVSEAEAETPKPKVLLFNCGDMSDVCDELGLSYDSVSASTYGLQSFLEKPDTDLSQYACVIREASGMADRAKSMNLLNYYLSLGGTIVWDFGRTILSEYSSIFDDLDAVSFYDVLFDGVTVNRQMSLNNYIVDAEHPIITGELTNSIPLTDSDLLCETSFLWTYARSEYCVDPKTLPEGSNVLVRNENGYPTLVDFPVGNGHVILKLFGGATQLWDDMILYAIGENQIPEAQASRDYIRALRDTCKIHVCDADCKPLSGAKISIELAFIDPHEPKETLEYETGSSGMIRFDAFGGADTRTGWITVRLEGYQTRRMQYTLERDSNIFFYLVREKNPNHPYPISVSIDSKRNDLLTGRWCFDQTDPDFEPFFLFIAGEWHGQEPAAYTIYQKDEAGNHIAERTTIDEDGKGIIFYDPYPINPSRPHLPDDPQRMPFQPGLPVYLELQDERGVKSDEIRLGLVVLAPGETQEDWLQNLHELNLLEETTVPPEEGEAAPFFPGDFDISGLSLPMQMKLIDNGDGTKTVRYLLGVGKAEFNDILGDDEEKWTSFVKDFGDAKERNLGDQLLDKYRDKLYNDKVNMGSVDCSFKALGYYEARFDDRGNLIQQRGGLIVKGGVEYSWGETYVFDCIPCYVEFKLGAELDVRIGAKLTFIAGDPKWGYDGAISITLPEITLGAGFGIYGVVQLGIEGKETVEFALIPEPSATITLGLYLRVKVMFLIDASLKIVEDSRPLFSSGKGMPGAYRIVSASSQLSSTAFRKRTSQWSGSNELLQDWVLPGTVPELVTVGDQPLLLFQSAYGDNGVKLYYSRWTGSGWSSPAMVCRDTTNDTFFQTAVYGDQLYVALQKVSQEVDYTDADTAMADMTKYSEIYVAKWNPTTFRFHTPTRLTDNDSLDMTPRIGADADGLTVGWVNCAADEYLPVEGGSGYRICTRRLTDGVWQDAELRAEIPDYVTDLAVGGDQLAYLSNETVWLLTEDGAKAVSSADAVPDGLHCCDDGLYWAENGTIYAYQNGARNAVTDGSTLIGANYKLLRSSDRTLLVWLDAQDVKACVAGADGWSDAVILHSFDETCRVTYFDVAQDKNGALLLVADVESETEDGTKTSLLAEKIKPACDIAVDCVKAFATEQQDGIQPITIHATNLGDLPVTSLRVEITNNSKSLFSQTLDCSIAPGAEWTLDVPLDVSELGNCELTVTLTASGDRDTTNDTGTAVINPTDVAVEVECRYLDNTILACVTVTNESEIDAYTALKLTDGDLDEVLSVTSLGILKPGEQAILTWPFDLDEMDFGELEYKRFFFTAETIETDCNTDNNIDFVTAYPGDRIELGPEPLRNPFIDVFENDYYYVPVLWAYYHDPQVTTGTSKNKFSPGNTCTRAQVVTFLWRAKGCPEPESTGNPFTDVSENDYFYKAVLWAKETGVTAGTSADKFSPGNGCTRAQVVTFLWRAEGEPAPAGTNNPFTDVPAGRYYTDAVLWAVENGVTTGTSATTFSPDKTCTRGQIVTFLYRDLVE